MSVVVVVVVLIVATVATSVIAALSSAHGDIEANRFIMQFQNVHGRAASSTRNRASSH
jgi:hypothetical protein